MSTGLSGEECEALAEHHERLARLSYEEAILLPKLSLVVEQAEFTIWAERKSFDDDRFIVTLVLEKFRQVPHAVCGVVYSKSNSQRRLSAREWLDASQV